MACQTNSAFSDKNTNNAGNGSLTEDWLGRWNEGRTGWHEPGGNAGLKTHWPDLPAGSRVLVPLCGKSPDLLWLAEHGCAVAGVEMSGAAISAFFSENDLAHRKDESGRLDRFIASDVSIELFCGDYFKFDNGPFDALYDRGALVALSADSRPRYVEHTKSLLKEDAVRFVVTLEYEQSTVSGPPFSVSAEELAGYWNDLDRVEVKDDIENCPPKFRAAGLQEISENFWLSSRSDSG